MNTNKAVVIGLVVLVIMGLLGATALVVRAYRAPLGPALDVPGPTAAVVEVQANQIPAAQPAVCGEKEAWNLLVLGSDAADLMEPKGSDLTRMVRADFPNKKVTIFAFPRDLWVDTAGLGLTNPDIAAIQLGQVFYEARSRSTSADPKAAMVDATETTARTLAKEFLVGTDHYLALDLAQVPAMVDEIDGVPMNVPSPVKDVVSNITIQAGQQTLDGAHFVAYARAVPDSDYARIQRNNLLLEALRQKALDQSTWPHLPGLFAQFKDVFATDLTPGQIEHLTCLLRETPGTAIIYDGVRPEWTSPGPVANSLLWDKTAVNNRLQELGLTP
jgi:LCP family protein required for cell wall assembly